jgi:hypothetical protein
MLEEQTTIVPPGPGQVETIVDGVSYLNNVMILGPDADGVWLNIALNPAS